MVNPPETIRPEASVTRNETGVTPTGNTSPALCELVMTKFTQLSEGVGSVHVMATSQLAAAYAVILAGMFVNLGLIVSTTRTR